MADTDNLNLPLIEASQAQKHVTHNEAILGLDAMTMLSIIDKDLATPPGSPSNGDRYIVASSGTGDWSGEDGKVAAYQNGAWEFYTPQTGWIAYVEDESILYKYESSAWSKFNIAASGNGAGIEFRVEEEELTGLTGSSVTTTIAFPNQCIVLGATTRVTTAITGATSFDAGDGSTVDRFGGTLGVALDSQNQGTVGPAGNYTSTTITLTANGGNFTAGAVRVAIMYIYLQPPTS